MVSAQGWMDLGDCLVGGYNIVWCCRACHKSAEVSAEAMIARYGSAKTLQVLESEGRCKVVSCGSPGRVFTRAKVMPSPSRRLTDGNSNFSTPGSRL